MTRIIHNLPIPKGGEKRQRSRRQRQVAKRGAVDSDQAQVQAVATDPNQRTIRGQYRDPDHAEKMLAELEELFASDGYDVVALYDDTGATPQDGYVTPEELAESGPLDPRDSLVQAFDGTITREGSRGSHWRAVATQPQDITNPFGSATTEEVAIPSTASKVRWYDPVAQDTTEATQQRTREGEVATAAIYDVTEPSFGNDQGPRLVYTVDYADESPVGCLVWDTRGNASREDGNGNTQWQRVFISDHDFEDSPVVSNGILRLTFDEANNSLSAERWDATNDTYSSVSLGASDWELYDLNLRSDGGFSISDARVTAQVEFRDTTTSPTSFYNLNMALSRGYEDAIWYEPANEDGSTPSGLVTLLDPVAADSDRYVAAEKTVVKRSKTDK